MDNKQAIIPATDSSPKITYVKPEPIVIDGFAEIEAKIKAELDKVIDPNFDGTISPEAIENISKADYKGAKELRTALNNRAKGIDQRRKEVKQAYTSMLKPFEQDANHLRGLYLEKSALLKMWIDSVDEAQRVKKRNALKDYWEGVSLLSVAIDFERIEKDAWLLKKTTIKQAEEEMLAVAQRIADDLESIEEDYGEWALQCRTKYIETLDLSATRAYRKELEEIARRTRAMDTERAKHEVEVPQVTSPEQTKPTHPVYERTPAGQIPTMSFALRFMGGSKDMEDFKRLLKVIMKDCNITYEQVGRH